MRRSQVAMYVGLVGIVIFTVTSKQLALEWNMQIKGIAWAYSIYWLIIAIICQIIMRYLLKEFAGIFSFTRQMFR